MESPPGHAPGEAAGYEAYDEDTDYAVYYTDWFGGLSVTIKELADAYRKAHTDNPFCAVLDERPVRFKDYEGREFEVKNGQGLTTSRIFLVRSRLYTLTATTDEEHGSTQKFREKSRRFLESFALLDS